MSSELLTEKKKALDKPMFLIQDQEQNKGLLYSWEY